MESEYCISNARDSQNEKVLQPETIMKHKLHLLPTNTLFIIIIKIIKEMMIQCRNHSTSVDLTRLPCRLSLPSPTNLLLHTTNHRSRTDFSPQRRSRRFQAKIHRPHPMQSVDSQTTLQFEFPSSTMRVALNNTDKRKKTTFRNNANIYSPSAHPQPTERIRGFHRLFSVVMTFINK